MTHTGKGFSVVNETEADVFLEFPCFLYDPVNVNNLISGSPAFSKPSLEPVVKRISLVTLLPIGKCPSCGICLMRLYKQRIAHCV